jgi:hypothetical protein
MGIFGDLSALRFDCEIRGLFFCRIQLQRQVRAEAGASARGELAAKVA